MASSGEGGARGGVASRVSLRVTGVTLVVLVAEGLQGFRAKSHLLLSVGKVDQGEEGDD